MHLVTVAKINIKIHSAMESRGNETSVRFAVGSMPPRREAPTADIRGARK